LGDAAFPPRSGIAGRLMHSACGRSARDCRASERWPPGF
jgi:hypothetical protein